MANNLKNAESGIRFFNVLGRLKRLPRTGWVLCGIPQVESVADHMYRMSMMAMLVTDDGVDRDRLMKICLVHDLAEAYAGDITPHCKVTKEEKRKLEEDALERILTDLGEDATSVANEIRQYWLEYEESTTVEAILAKQLDKLEMIVQANEYERLHPEIRLESFFTSTKDSFIHPRIVEWAEVVRKEHYERYPEVTESC